MGEENLIFMGDQVKATRTEEGLKLAGYLVRFSDEKSPDLTGEFFDADTDYDIDDYPAQKSTYFNHGMDEKLGKRKLGSAKLTIDEYGIWAETLLKERDEYEQFLSQLAADGKLAWSSGTAGHLMDRRSLPSGATYIVRWPIVEASLTHTPAEYRNVVQPVKALSAALPEAPEGAAQTVEQPQAEPVAEIVEETQETKEKSIMEPEEIKQLMADMATKAAEAAVEEYRKSEPAPKSPTITVVTDESDQPFKHIGEFFQAVKNAAMYPSDKDRRLLPLKANGMNETEPADGGYLVPASTAGGIVERMYGMGKILSRVSKDPVQGNNMSYNAIDETSRASNRHGGVLGYWMAEAASKTGSKPKFRQVDLKLKKVAALAYATDELLSDAGALESWINRTVPGELVFQTEDAIFEGDGSGKPLGIMQSPSLVSVLREDANKIQTTDILKMWARRWGGPSGYVWLANQDAMPQIYTLNNANQNLFIPAGINGAPSNLLMGVPIEEVEYASSLGTTGDIVLAALDQYKAVESASSIHVAFLTDETVFRFVYRVDGAPMWHSHLTPFKGSNTQSPFVCLTSAST